MAGLLRELSGILTRQERLRAATIGGLVLAGALAETVGCCDRVIVMRDGAVAACERYDELRGRAAELDESSAA